MDPGADWRTIMSTSHRRRRASNHLFEQGASQPDQSDNQPPLTRRYGMELAFAGAANDAFQCGTSDAGDEGRAALLGMAQLLGRQAARRRRLGVGFSIIEFAPAMLVVSLAVYAALLGLHMLVGR
jgi:hypothetical protein